MFWLLRADDFIFFQLGHSTIHSLITVAIRSHMPFLTQALTNCPSASADLLDFLWWLDWTSELYRMVDLEMELVVVDWYLNLTHYFFCRDDFSWSNYHDNKYSHSDSREYFLYTSSGLWYLGYFYYAKWLSNSLANSTVFCGICHVYEQFLKVVIWNLMSAIMYHSPFSWFEHWSAYTIIVSPNPRNTSSTMKQQPTVYLIIDLCPFGQSIIMFVSLSIKKGWFYIAYWEWG